MKEVLSFIRVTYLGVIDSGWIESMVSMRAVGPYLVANRQKNTRIPARVNNMREVRITN